MDPDESSLNRTYTKRAETIEDEPEPGLLPSTPLPAEEQQLFGRSRLTARTPPASVATGLAPIPEAVNPVPAEEPPPESVPEDPPQGGARRRTRRPAGLRVRFNDDANPFSSTPNSRSATDPAELQQHFQNIEGDIAHLRLSVPDQSRPATEQQQEDNRLRRLLRTEGTSDLYSPYAGDEPSRVQPFVATRNLSRTPPPSNPNRPNPNLSPDQSLLVTPPPVAAAVFDHPINRGFGSTEYTPDTPRRSQRLAARQPGNPRITRALITPTTEWEQETIRSITTVSSSAFRTLPQGRNPQRRDAISSATRQLEPALAAAEETTNTRDKPTNSDSSSSSDSDDMNNQQAAQAQAQAAQQAAQAAAAAAAQAAALVPPAAPAGAAGGGAAGGGAGGAAGGGAGGGVAGGAAGVGAAGGGAGGAAGGGAAGGGAGGAPAGGGGGGGQVPPPAPAPQPGGAPPPPPPAAGGIAGGAAIFPRPRVPMFESDQADKWMIWKKRFQVISMQNGWDDQQKMYELQKAMDGVAALATHDIPFIFQPHLYTYDVMEARYEACFITQSGSELSRTEFRMAAQTADETELQYHNRLRMLFHKAFPDPADQFARQSDLKERFIWGLSDTNIARAIHRAMPNTYNDCYTVCEGELKGKLMESEAKASRKTGRSIHAMGGGYQQGGSNNPNNNRNSSDSRPGYSRQCPLCNSPAHYGYQCPKLKEARIAIGTDTPKDNSNGSRNNDGVHGVQGKAQGGRNNNKTGGGRGKPKSGSAGKNSKSKSGGGRGKPGTPASNKTGQRRVGHIGETDQPDDLSGTTDDFFDGVDDDYDDDSGNEHRRA